MSMRDKIEHAIQNQPCTVKELKQKFGGERGADRKVMEALDELVREAVVCQRQGVFFTVRSGRADKALLCKVVKLGKNFAFVMLEDGTSDIFIPGRFTKGAMPGDDVLVEKFEHPRVEGSDEGAILAILTEKNDLVGTVRRVEGRLRFVPDDCPAITMPLARDCEGGAKDGDKVAVEILNRGNRQEDHRVGVAMRFGSSDEAKRCAKALLYAKDIRTRFPDKVRDEAKKFEGAEVSEKDCEGRMDLRALPIFTIDSAETKDIDDAVSLTRTSDGGFELGVHIADVSNYVKPGTELDNEAFSRATSVYYADQVVPMLPKALSNGICSLNENELRLAFSCLMRLDKDGNLTDYRFVKSIIRSRVKGVYSEINALLAGTADAEIKAKYADVIDQLPAMKELYGHRARLRKERGCMDIESGEVKLILDEDGTGVLDMFLEVADLKWEAKDATTVTITAEDESHDLKLKDDKLVLEVEGDKLIFTKSDKDLSGTVKKDREAAEKEEEVDEAVEDDDVQSVVISPAVTVADDDLCTITITEKFKDDWGDIGFVVNITNKSDKDLTFYAPSGKTNVNGTMKEPWFSANLMPGTSATEEFTFSSGELDSLDDLVNTTIGIDAYLTDSYEDVASYSATIA